MGILAIIVVGLLAGALARLLLPGRQTMGLIITLLLGVAGSVVGAAASTLVSTRGSLVELRPVMMLFSVIGALVVLGLASVGHRLRA